MKAPRIVPTMNYGNILQTVVFTAGILGATWSISDSQATLRSEVSTQRGRLDLIAPKVEALIMSTPIQDERIGNLADAVREQRRMSAEILAQMSAIREGMARLEAQLQRDGVPLPRLQPPIRN